MTEPLGLDALRERLREYDPSLPRCKQRITRTQNCAPDFVPEEERAEWDMVTYVPCCRPEGHEGACRNTRLVLGFPGYDTLTALLDEVQELRMALAECVGADLSRADVRDAEKGAAACDQMIALLDGFPVSDPCPEAARVAVLLDEVRHLRAQRVLDNEEAARLYDFARDKGAALERDATVAYLLKGTADCKECMDEAVVRLAREVERGEHRAQEKP